MALIDARRQLVEWYENNMLHRTNGEPTTNRHLYRLMNANRHVWTIAPRADNKPAYVSRTVCK